MAELYKLTDEHRAQLEPWANKWIDIIMSCKEMDAEDKRITHDAINGLYEAAELALPKNITFVSSPLVLAFAGGFAAGLWHLASENAGPRMGKTIYAGLNKAIDEVGKRLEESPSNEGIKQRIEEAVYEATKGLDFSRLKCDQDVADFLLGCASMHGRMWNGGNQWGQYVSYLSFFRHIVKLNIDYSKWRHYEDAAIHSGPRIMTKDFCMVSDRPKVIHVDSDHRPHQDNGPFCEWRDGWALYYVHGVKVPRYVIEEPDLITPTGIEAEENAEVRRVMLDKFGWDRYLEVSDATLMGSDDWGEIYRKDIPDDEPLFMVKVTNASPEPDGHHRQFFLRVDPEAYNGAASTVPHAAVASTWRRKNGDLVFKKYQHYRPEIQT